MEFRQLVVSVPNPNFWKASDELQAKYVSGLNHIFNHKYHKNFLKRRMPRAIRNMLKGIPVMTYSIVAETALQKVLGLCDEHDPEIVEVAASFAISPRPEMCGIVIPIESLRMSDAALKSTISHELIHHAQWKRGDFYCCEDGKGNYWKGKLYRNKLLTSKMNEPFEVQLLWEIETFPWEAEAYFTGSNLREVIGNEDYRLYWKLLKMRRAWYREHNRKLPKIKKFTKRK